MPDFEYTAVSTSLHVAVAAHTTHETQATMDATTKYVSEGSTVRDCVQKCAEKETWGTRTYCCREDGCNTASLTWGTLPTWLLLCGVLATQLSALLNRLPH